MSNNRDDNKLWFKIDKDKIKLQLKDLGNKFVDSRNRKRKISILISVCLVIGLGLALYINYNQKADVVPDMNADIKLEPTDTLPQEETIGGEEVEFVSNPKSGVRLDLKQQDLTLNQTKSPGENMADQSPTQTHSRAKDNANQKNRLKQQSKNESEVTAPLRPIDQVTGPKDLNLLRPVSGKIIQKPGWYFHPVFQDWRYQTGIKLEGQSGNIVMAALGGEVSSIKEDNYLGIMVTLQHENGWKTIYGHLEKAAVTEGETVAKGQEIGRVGKSGLLEEPALYFELNHKGEALEASNYFE